MTDIHTLLKQLQSDDVDAICTAATVLGHQQISEVVQPLLDLLTHDDASVRLAAMTALRRIRDERASVPFIDLLNDPDTAIRRGASTWFMTISGDQSALVEPLCAVMLAEASRMSTREFAAMLLGKYGDERAIPALHQAMTTYPRLQTRITQTLRRMADPRSVPVLLPLLGDQHEMRLQATAAKTLEAIGTPDALEAARAWREKRGRTGPDERK